MSKGTVENVFDNLWKGQLKEIFNTEKENWEILDLNESMLSF